MASRIRPANERPPYDPPRPADDETGYGLFVDRVEGAIVATYTVRQSAGQEFLPYGHADLLGLDLAAAKAAKLRLVGVELDRRNRAGFTWQGHAYQIDDASQARINAMNSLAKDAPADWPEGFAFIDAANVAVPFAAEDFTPFAVAAALKVIARRVNARALKDAILAAGDAAALAAIDITTGWD